MAWIEKRGNKFRVRWDTKTSNNKRRYNEETFDTADDAKQYLKKIEYESSVGLVVSSTKMTIEEYLSHWLNLHGNTLAPKTLASYQCEIKNHVIPNLGDIKLSRLTPLDLQNYYDTLLKRGKIELLERYKAGLDKKRTRALKIVEKRLAAMEKEGTGGLSPTTVRYQHRILHKALQQAYLWQMIPRNVADAVQLPKAKKVEIDYLQKDQVTRFISQIKYSEHYPVIAAAIMTGMRQGEILGLRWQDVDLDLGIIHIRQQVQYLPGRGFFFKEPKQSSKRDIPMQLPLNAIIRQIAKEQEKMKAIYEEAQKQMPGSEKYQDHDLVFCNYNGSPIDGTILTKQFQRLLAKNGLPKIRFHGLRHTFATMCRAAGMDLGDVQDLLGHADISTTKKLYTHVEIEPLQQAMSKLERYMSS